MHCAVCNCEETKVVDSRLATDGASVRRRRECEKCGFRFSTIEEVELLDLVVVKADGRREEYAREKILRGLQKALEKRPYTQTNLQKLIHKIERDIQKKGKAQIASSDIGEFVMNRLRAFDKIAYIRFASVYRSFEDVDAFEQELRNLLKKKRLKKNG